MNQSAKQLVDLLFALAESDRIEAKLRRVGPARGGHWEVADKYEG